MSQLINILQAAKLCGLSVTTLRRCVANKSIPYTRANTATAQSKLLFDPGLLLQALKSEVMANLSTCDTPPKSSYLANLFKPSSDPTEAEAERNANFGYAPINSNKSGSFTK